MRVHPSNPRYFANAEGRAVRLAGHEVFVDLQEQVFNKPFTFEHERMLDWPAHLEFMRERGLNFIRSWVVWTTGSGSEAAPDRIARPMMYERTGPGVAADGLPRFDLTKFHQPFFDRMRERIALAATYEITVSVMLFEVYGFGPGEPIGDQSLWDGNVFRKENNVQGLGVEERNGWGMEFFYTTDAALLASQKAYVDKVLETIGDLDNVVLEVANELHSPAWQLDLVQYIHDYERNRPKQHLVYMSPGGRNRDGDWEQQEKRVLVHSGADCFGIDSSMGDFFKDPPIDGSGMPAIWDNDHVWGPDWGHHRRAWMAFTRGYHFVFYDAPFEDPSAESAGHERMRYNIGATVEYGERFADLARMEPSRELSSTHFCLADPGVEYLVYQPQSGPLTVELRRGEYRFEWFDPVRHRAFEVGVRRTNGGSESFEPPVSFTGDAVLYLRRAGS